MQSPRSALLAEVAGSVRPNDSRNGLMPPSSSNVLAANVRWHDVENDLVHVGKLPGHFKQSPVDDLSLGLHPPGNMVVAFVPRVECEMPDVVAPDQQFTAVEETKR